ncbi:hypothetical protein M0802_006208 [Mischocyttarus mexicanus]|nr:hypothetical protein M0802_006208 [Mischocyttarus mexicanus]
MGTFVPEGWLEYKPYGNVIKGTKILPFKVPLKEAIAQRVKPEERFTTTMILEAYPKLKIIVDLTNTERYYDKTEFTNAGVKYIKIMIPGKKVPPQSCVIKTVCYIPGDVVAAFGDVTQLTGRIRHQKA